MTTLSLPSTLTVIGSNVGQNMNALNELVIPASVRYIGSNSFADCESLRSVTFYGIPPLCESGVLGWLPDDCVYYVPDDYYDAYCALLEDIAWNPDVRKLGHDAIVEDLTAPESDFTFDAATGTITGYLANDPYVLVPSAIGDVQVKAIGEETFPASGSHAYPRLIVIPEGVERIGRAAFKNTPNSVVVLPDSVREIGEEAFMNYADYKISLPASLETIGSSAFENANLNELELPEGLVIIGDRAFYNCWALTEVNFPSTVTTVGAEAFGKSSGIARDITYLSFTSDTLPTFGADAFYNIAALADVDMPWDCSREAWLTACGTFAAMGAENCTVWRNNPPSTVAEKPANSSDVVTFENGLLMVYNGNQESLTLWTSYDGEEIVGLGEGVFRDNQALKRFYPHHCGWFTTIGASAFEGSGVEYVEMFDSITIVGSRAFADCASLTAIELPMSLESVAADAFSGCAALETVIVGCEPSVLPDGLLADCPVTMLTLPDDISWQEACALRDRLGVSGTAVMYRADGSTITDPTIRMAHAETDPADFWIDETYHRLDEYQGYELNLYLPREKDGTALTMLSANTLSRAMDKTYSATCELPVVSVAVPETYTEIVEGAFSDLLTVEVIVIYAPVETVTKEMFLDCSTLRTVIFVNGAKRVEKDAFTACYALETVYFGPDCVIEDGAFDFGTPEVLTELPDVDALLASVAAEPVAAPEPAAELTPTPVTDPAADVYLGDWYLTGIESDGRTMSPAMLGIESYVLTLREDGVAVIARNDETDAVLWGMTDGIAWLMTDENESSTIEMRGDGSIAFSGDGMTLMFVRDADHANGTESEPQAAAPETPGTEAVDMADRFDRSYVCVSASSMGYALNVE